MGLLNYTTTISVEKTTAEIIKILSNHGATAVLLEYDAPGQVGSISFKVKTPAAECAFRLPADWKATLSVLKRTAPRSYAREDQAQRVAWRIIKRWVEAQMALLETEMAKMEQIFLPYMVTSDGRTVFERLLSAQFQITDRQG